MKGIINFLFACCIIATCACSAERESVSSVDNGYPIYMRYVGTVDIALCKERGHVFNVEMKIMHLQSMAEVIDTKDTTFKIFPGDTYVKYCVRCNARIERKTKPDKKEIVWIKK